MKIVLEIRWSESQRNVGSVVTCEDFLPKWFIYTALVIDNNAKQPTRKLACALFLRHCQFRRTALGFQYHGAEQELKQEVRSDKS